MSPWATVRVRVVEKHPDMWVLRWTCVQTRGEQPCYISEIYLS